MFEFIVNFFDFILYFPLFNALVLIYDYIPGHDFGVAIIVLTLIIRLILYPLSVKALKSQRALQRLQGPLQEIQKKYKDDKEKQAKETMDLYRREKINPFSGLFLALIQLPILIALYRVFWNGLKPQELSSLYHFVANPVHVNAVFLGLMDLSKPNWIFAILAGVLQFFQTKMLLPKPIKDASTLNDMSQMMQKQMVYLFPIVTIIILLRLPSALGLYWIVSGLFRWSNSIFYLGNQKIISNNSMEEGELKVIKETIDELLQKMTVRVFDVSVESNSAIAGEKEADHVIPKDSVVVSVTVEGPQMLIGQSGQTLFELSRILRIVLNKKLQKDFYLDLDINDYKKKKIEYLKEIAKTAADEVAKTKEKKVLPPMPAYERRIIHAELAGRTDIATQSQGDGVDRCIVIVSR